MIHHQSLLGFSLLVLSCASPTLGHLPQPSWTSNQLSPPSTPTLGADSNFGVQDPGPVSGILPVPDSTRHTQAAESVTRRSLILTTAPSIPAATSAPSAQSSTTIDTVSTSDIAPDSASVKPALGNNPFSGSKDDQTSLRPSSDPAEMPRSVLLSDAINPPLGQQVAQVSPSMDPSPTVTMITDLAQVQDGTNGDYMEDGTNGSSTATSSFAAALPEESSSPVGLAMGLADSESPVASDLPSASVMAPFDPAAIYTAMLTPVYTTASVAPTSDSPTYSSSASSTLPTEATSASTSKLSLVATPAPSVTGVSPVLPSVHQFGDPNPPSSSEASERARKTALLAALLILGTLGALGCGVLCFRCGVLPCCHGTQRRRRGLVSKERTAEEGRRRHEYRLPVSTDVSSNEKSDPSIIPGNPPSVTALISFATIPRAPHAHTLSCSTCPPDSLNGVRGGVSGSPETSWPADVAIEGMSDMEDVTHILSSDAFSQVHSDESSTRSHSHRSAGSQDTAHTNASSGFGTGIGRMSTGTVSGAHVRTTSCASGGALSLSAESYTTCESKYSIPSTIEREGSVRVRSLSAFGSIAEEDEEGGGEDKDKDLGGSGDTGGMLTPALTVSSPDPEASSGKQEDQESTVRTPEQPDYTSLAFAALPKLRIVDVSATETETETCTDDMEIEAMDESDWDIARAYGAITPPPTCPLPPPSSTPKCKGKGRPRRTTGVGLVNQVESVAMGGRTLVVMHG